MNKLSDETWAALTRLADYANGWTDVARRADVLRVLKLLPDDLAELVSGTPAERRHGGLSTAP